MNGYRHFNTSRINDVLVVQLINPRLFDAIIINELQDELLAMLDKQQPRKLLVNFENVAQCSTSVINALLSAKKRLRISGGDVRLCHLAPMVHEAYKLLNLDGTVFHIHDTEADALRAFGQTPPT